MHILRGHRALLACAALLVGVAWLAGSAALAGDEAPAAAPAGQPSMTETPSTSTPTPVHSILKWVGEQVMGGQEATCPSTEQGEKAWRAWFAGGKDAALSPLRDALVADGWNADRTIGYFKQMAAAAKASSCQDCPSSKSCSDCPSKSGSGAAAPTGDAGASGEAAGSCCGHCQGAKKDCEGKSCKSEKSCKDCPSKAGSGAAAPTGDAGATGAKSCEKGTCPCTGKPKAECPGCDKPGCTCGKEQTAPKSQG
jgi:hypothetical protein